MANQSEFSKLNKKQLFFITKKLIEEDFPTDNPYNDYPESYNTLENIAKYFNMVVSDEDVQFFVKFIEINDNILTYLIDNPDNPKDKSLIERLEIPVAKTYDLHYTVWGSCTYTEYLAQKFDSYDKNWVKDSADQQREDGNWDYYDGRKLRDTEYDNFEESDHSYDEVYEVNDDKTINTNFVSDSILDKLVIENTEDVINSLDKKTLIELRRIIDSKLRLL
jgi:hypothetical protein